MYQLVGVCVSDPGLVPFDVLVQNDFRGSRAVTFTKLLEIKVYNISIVIDREYSTFVTVSSSYMHLTTGNYIFPNSWMLSFEKFKQNSLSFFRSVVSC